MLNSKIIGKICIHNYNTITIFNLEFYIISTFNHPRTWLYKTGSFLVELMLRQLRGKDY